MAHVAVVPVNGIGNRLRAIAACLYLARRLRRDATVVWEPDSLLPGKWEDLFAASPQLQFASMKTAQRSGIVPHEPIAKYVDSNASFVTLRGNDRGEQPFAKHFFRLLKRWPQKNGVVEAGDYFHHRASSVEKAGKLLKKERNHLANQIRFSDQILELAHHISPPRPYLSLHLRGTDRTVDAANPESLLATAHKLAIEKGLRDVFVASDDPHLIDLAKSSLDAHGLKISTNPQPKPRGTLSGTFSAFADYLALRRGDVFVGGKRSTFSTEIGITFPGSNIEML